MQATSFVICPPLSRNFTGHSFGKKYSSSIAHASRREHDQDHYSYKSRLVDESMIVLRKRLHEMKMVEKNYEAPEHWMDWEKRWYTSYDEFICSFMGVLQTRLMDMRPSLALGIVALVALSVPMSTTMVFLHLVEIAKGILRGVH